MKHDYISPVFSPIRGDIGGLLLFKVENYKNEKAHTG